jgi:heme exporter protein C
MDDEGTHDLMTSPARFSLHALARPAMFLRLAGGVCGVLAPFTMFLFVVGLPWALWLSPPDRLHGDLVRLMYIHVPAAWAGMMAYALCGLSGAGYWIWRHPVASLISEGFAEMAAILSALCLITGMLWGKPAWGAWWVWDMRLTTMLLLFLLSVSVLLSYTLITPPALSRKIGAMLATVGLINLPLISFSVAWWTTLHQPASIRWFAKDSMDIAMKAPLLTMALAFTAFTLWAALRRAMLRLQALKESRGP